MGLTFGNLPGLWALLGIPVVLLIHFLQKERRAVVTSTLFLLEEMQRESKSGIRIERLRNSLPLWLQILAVVLLAWVLSQPRWMRPDSFQRVVVVLDSSASMSAFRDEALSRLDREVQKLARASTRTEWIALETDPRRGTLYSGNDSSALLAALDGWQPLSARHDAGPALQQARSLLRREGAIIFLTARPREDVPAGARMLSIGSPIDNCGFTGLRFEERPEGHIWHALVRNYSDRAQTRQWQAVFQGQASPSREIYLEPGQTMALSGRFPEETNLGFLRLSDDRFGLDDRMPLARPQPKPLAILVEDHPMLSGFVDPFLRSVSAWHAPQGGASEDLRIATRLPNQTAPARPGVYFLAEREQPGRLLTAPIVAEHHPLMQELNWQGLLVQATGEIAPDERDQVLLWQGDRPLLVLRESGRQRWLLCNFDLRYSNAARLPAFVILLHRFLDEVREAKPEFERRNLQSSQTVATGADALGKEVIARYERVDGQRTEQRVEPFRAARMAAPDAPGFWEVRQGESLLLQAAVHFADSREADFRSAATGDHGPEIAPTLQKKNTTADFLTPLWLLLLGVFLVANWRLTAGRNN